jgi:hypothetical protein
MSRVRGGGEEEEERGLKVVVVGSRPPRMQSTREREGCERKTVLSDFKSEGEARARAWIGGRFD